MGDVVSFGALRHMSEEISDMVKRSAIARGLGQMFGGLRDLYSALGYRRPNELKAEHLRERYERGEIAGVVCDTWPNATWKDGAEVVENEDVETITAFEQAFMDLDERLQVWNAFRRTDILAQMGEYATLLIGAPGQLQTEMPQLRGPESILYLQPYGADSLVVETLDDNPASPRFGMVATYRLKRVSNKRANQKLSEDRIIHWSRVVHAADGLLDDNVYSSSLRLRRVWNRLDDLDKVAGAGSEAFWRRAHQGTAFKVDKDLKIEADEKKKLQEQVDEFEHGLRRVLRLRGVDVEQLGSDVADFSNSVDCLLKLISAGSQIPKRILEGSERGELASTSDQENFDSRVNDRRTQYAEPIIVRQFVDRLIAYGGLPAPKSKKYLVLWPDRNSLTMSERVEMAVKAADMNQKSGIDVATPNEIREKILGWEVREELEDLPVEREEEEVVDPDAPPDPDAEEEDEDADENADA